MSKLTLASCILFVMLGTLSFGQKEQKALTQVIQSEFNDNVQSSIVELIDAAVDYSYEEDFWQMMLAEVIDNREELLMHLVKESYGKYLSEKEMIKTGAFLNSPTGKKLIRYKGGKKVIGFTPEDDSYFDKKELKEIKKFNTSSVGKKLFFYQSTVKKDIVRAANKWIEGRSDKAMERVEEENKKRFEIQLEGCKTFRTGTFFEKRSNSSVVKIVRGEEYQMEYQNGKYYKLKIDWKSDCYYTLTFEESDDPNANRNNEIIGNNIYEIFPDGYSVISKSNSPDAISVRTRLQLSEKK